MPKILGVDDSVTMRRILEMTFSGDPGTSIATVEDGDSAVRWAAENGADIVLADASMGGTDGYEIARALRSSPATQNVAVIVLASQHTPYDAEKGRACGVDDHVLKPFETTALIDKVRDVLSRPRAAATGAPRPVAAAPARVAPSAVAQPASPPAAAASPPRPPSPGVPGVVAPPAQRAPQRATVAFGPPGTARPAVPGAARPAAPAVPSPAVPAPASTARKPALELAEDDALPLSPAPTPAPAPAAPVAARPAAVAAATAPNGEMAGKLEGMGLTPEQVQGVLALSREVIERVVWEVVPDLAETIIREEIRRLTSS